jgi:hypothetical protein
MSTTRFIGKADFSFFTAIKLERRSFRHNRSRNLQSSCSEQSINGLLTRIALPPYYIVRPNTVAEPSMPCIRKKTNVSTTAGGRQRECTHNRHRQPIGRAHRTVPLAVDAVHPHTNERIAVEQRSRTYVRTYVQGTNRQHEIYLVCLLLY